MARTDPASAMGGGERDGARPGSTPAERPPSRTAPVAPADQLLRRTAEIAASYLADLEDRPVRATATRRELLAALDGPLPDAGMPALEVVERLARDAEPGLVGIAGSRYFGFVIGGSLPAALAADWLTAAWDQNAGVFAAGPAASVVEEIVGRWLLELFGLPADAGFGLTTGCQMAHVTCLAAARHRVLARHGWDVEADGLAGAPRIRVVASEEAHATIPTALQYLGLGRATIPVATDGEGRIRLDGPGGLAERLPADEGPLVVCLQAGNVNTGSFDPLADAIALVRERRPDAWIHVDGAFGLWAAAVPSLRGLVAGIEGADSWATDGHKWLNVPYDCGYAFVRDADAHIRALSPPSAAYIIYGDAERDEFRWVPEYSRRARAFPTYAALRSLGRTGVESLVDGHGILARRFADGLRAGAAASGAAPVEILNDVVLNQVLVRFPATDRTGADPEAERSAGDERTRAVVDRVQRDGTCWLSGTTWHGMAAMRISVINWQTTAEDVDRSVDAVLRAAAAG